MKNQSEQIGEALTGESLEEKKLTTPIEVDRVVTKVTSVAKGLETIRTGKRGRGTLSQGTFIVGDNPKIQKAGKELVKLGNQLMNVELR